MTSGSGALAAARTAATTPVSRGELGRDDAGRDDVGRDDVGLRHVPDGLSLNRRLLATMLARRQPVVGDDVQMTFECFREAALFERHFG